MRGARRALDVVASKRVGAIALVVILALSVSVVALGAVEPVAAETPEGTVYVGENEGVVVAIDAETGNVKWEFEAGDRVVSSPTVESEKVYVGSWDHHVYAIDHETGEEVWSFETNDMVDSSPTIAYGTVYVGTRSGFYALDAQTGEEVWSIVENDDIWSSPYVKEGTVYFGSKDDNKFYAVDALTGEIEWEFQAGGTVYSPKVVNGTVYVGVQTGILYAFDAETGDEEWSHDTGMSYGVDNPVAVVDGAVYAGASGPTEGSFHKIDAETGAEIWAFEPGDVATTAPLVDDGTVYFGSGDNDLYALNTTSGDMVWNYSMGGSVVSSPTAYDGTLFIGSYDGEVLAIDAETGTQEWLTQIEGSWRVQSSPTFVSPDADSSDGLRVTLGTLGHIGYDDLPEHDVTGSVTDQNGDPVEGADVELIDPLTGSTFASATTDENGEWGATVGDFEGLPARYRLFYDGDLHDSGRVLLDRGSHYEWTITLETWDQEFRLVDFSETFEPEESQLVLENAETGEQIGVDQFGPENRAELEVDDRTEYRVRVTNQDGDIYTSPMDSFRYDDRDRVITIYIDAEAEFIEDEFVWRLPDPGDEFNLPPVARIDADPLGPIVGETVTFDGSESYDPDGEIVAYRWTIDGETMTGETVDHTFTDPGVYDIELEVEDDDGSTAGIMLGIFVADEPGDGEDEDDVRHLPPSPYIWMTPEAAEVGELVTFDGLLSFGGGAPIAEYRWSIDGVERTGQVVDESFNEPGIKEVSLTVIDEEGAYRTVTAEIAVYETVHDDGGVLGPLGPGDGVAPGSLLSLLAVLGVGTATVATTVYVDQRTHLELPKWVIALPAALTSVVVIEGVAPGVITVPLWNAIDMLGPLIVLAGIGAVFMFLRSWRSRDTGGGS